MAIEAGNVVWNITGNVKPLNDALGDSEKMVQSSMGNILKIGQQIGVAFTAIGAGITAGFATAIKATMDYGGEIQDAATKTGIAAEELQKLKYGAEQSGVGFEGLQGAIIKMNKSIAEARDGAKSQSEAFQRLGIDLKSLQGLSPDQQFMRIADALSRVTDPALKTSLAMDLFGKSGAQLIPFLNEGAAGMQALGQKAQELGLVMSGDSIAQAEAFGDQWETLKTQFQMVAVQIGSALIPALMEMMPAIQAAVASVINWIQQNPQLVTTIATVVGAIGAVMAILGPLLVMLPGIVMAFSAIGPVVTAVGGALLALTGPVGIVIAAIAAIVAAGIYMYNHWEEVVEGAKVLWDGFKETMVVVWDAIVNTFKMAVGLALQPFIHFIELVKTGWEGLIALGDVLVGAFEYVWDSIVGGFTWVGDQLTAIWDWITGLVNSGVQGIVDAVNYLTNLFGIGDVFSNPTGDTEGRALGGPVTAGVPYIVGERGEELFVPDSNGRIIPNNQTRQMLGGNGGGIGSITINIDGAQDPRATAEAVSRELYRQQVAFGMA